MILDIAHPHNRIARLCYSCAGATPVHFLSSSLSPVEDRGTVVAEDAGTPALAVGNLAKGLSAQDAEGCGTRRLCSGRGLGSERGRSPLCGKEWIVTVTAKSKLSNMTKGTKK